MAELDLMEKIVSLAKRRGFVFQGSEIYGGLAGTWDYGPLGVALKQNIKNIWWKRFVTDREDMYGVDAAILMNPRVWEASGHTGAGFADPMVECLKCNARFRADHLLSGVEGTYFENSFEAHGTASITDETGIHILPPNDFTKATCSACGTKGKFSTNNTAF